MNSTTDQKRIDFLLERDGAEGALEFARMAARCYRGAVLASKRKFGRRGAYRTAYIESYLFHKRYAEEHTE